LQARRYDEAIEAFSLTLEIIPHDYEAYNNRGVAWFFKGGYNKAIRDFTKALKINPNFSEAFCNRGTTWFYKGAHDSAIRDCTQAINKDPTLFQAYCSRAAAWEKKGDYLQAVKNYTEAQKINPAYPWMNPEQKRPASFGNKSTFNPQTAIVIQLLNAQIKAQGLLKHLDRLKAQIPTAMPKEEVIVANVKIPPKIAEKHIVKEKRRLSKRSDNKASKADPHSKHPYTIQVASYKSLKNAIFRTLKLRKGGHLALTTAAKIPGKGDWYRVFIGLFATRDEARKAAGDLKKHGFGDMLVTKQPYAFQIQWSGAEQELAKLRTAFRSRGFTLYQIKKGPGNKSPRLLAGAFRIHAAADKQAAKLIAEGYRVKVVRR